MPEAPRSASRLHYAWVVAALMFVVMIAVVGARSGPSVLIVPIEHAFGWSRGTISAAISVNILLMGMVGPFVTALFTTLGLKRTILLALSILSGSTILSGFISEPWHLFATWGVMVGLTSGLGGGGLAATIANRWFVARRGLVVGLLMAANASGQLVFLPLLAHIAESGNWRLVSFVIGSTIAVLLPLVAYLLPETPGAIALAPFGAPPGEKPAAALRPSGNPIAVAFGGLGLGVRSVDFWLLFASFFVCGFSANGLVSTHLIAYCMDHGITEVAAAGLLAGMGMFDLVGTTASGWLTDRYDSRVLLFWYYGLRGLSLILLPFTSFDWLSLSAFTVFYGLDFIATIPPTVALSNQAFGKERAPVIVAWIFCGHQIGAAVAALGAGVVRSATGSYFGAFIASGVACLLAALLVLRIARRPAALVAAE
jgi:MFS family permease